MEKLLCSDCDRFRCICSNRSSSILRPNLDNNSHQDNVNVTSPAAALPPATTLLKRLSQKFTAASSISPSSPNKSSSQLPNNTLSVSNSCNNSLDYTTFNETSSPVNISQRWPQRSNNSSDIDEETIIYSNSLQTKQ